MEQINSCNNMSMAEEKLSLVFKNKFNIDFQREYEELLDENLLGTKLKFKPRDLLYLLDEIEKEFHIILPQKDIAEGKFSSFNNILMIISSCYLRY